MAEPIPEKEIDGAYELPEGWVWAKVSTICQVVSGCGFPKKFQGKSNRDFPFFKVRDISNCVLHGQIILKEAENYVLYDDCDLLKTKPLKKGLSLSCLFLFSVSYFLGGFWVFFLLLKRCRRLASFQRF